MIASAESSNKRRSPPPFLSGVRGDAVLLKAERHQLLSRDVARGWAGGSMGSTQPSDHRLSNPVASSRLSSSMQRNRQLRLVPGRRPVRPSRCRNEATVRVDPIWMTRSRSPTSMPSSRVEVATMTVSRASAKAAGATPLGCRERGSADVGLHAPLT